MRLPLRLGCSGVYKSVISEPATATLGKTTITSLAVGFQYNRRIAYWQCSNIGVSVERSWKKYPLATHGQARTLKLSSSVLHLRAIPIQCGRVRTAQPWEHNNSNTHCFLSTHKEFEVASDIFSITWCAIPKCRIVHKFARLCSASWR